MQKLNFPDINCQIKKQAGKDLIFDQCRKKYVRLTPEEWVRQHTVAFLASQGYPIPLMKLEAAVNGLYLPKRTDIVVYDRKAKPFLLVECKAPEVKLGPATAAQAALYNYALRCPFMLLTNGLQHHVFEIDFNSKNFAPLMELPPFHNASNDTAPSEF